MSLKKVVIYFHAARAASSKDAMCASHRAACGSAAASQAAPLCFAKAAASAADGA